MARTKVNGKKTAQQLYPRTITPELHNEWLRMRRLGDVNEVSERSGKSLPTTNRALLYGHVNSQAFIDFINAFFTARIENENEQAKKFADGTK